MTNFAAACLPYCRELRATALRMTRCPSDADDLVQETLLYAMRAWDSFVDMTGAGPRSWLYRILTNVHIDHWRRVRRHHRFAEDRREDVLAALYGDRTTGVESAPSDKISPEVGAALSELGAEYLAVVDRVDARGHMYREVAADLGIPIGTVMSRLHRGRRKLAAKLRDYARAEYGLGSAGQDAAALEAPQAVETETHGVQGVVRVRDDGALRVR